MKNSLMFQVVDRDISAQIERELICPKCGNLLACLIHTIEEDVKETYTCNECQNEVHTLVYKHEVFFV